jgi:hypothetical protein
MALAAVVPASSLWDRIRTEIDFDPDATDQAIADRLLADITKHDLRPLLIDAIGTIRRDRVRHVERHLHPVVREYLDRPDVKAMSKVERMTAFNRLRGLRKETIDLGDGSVVAWGRATVEQLKLRRTMLVTQRNGIDATVTQIDTVIALLEKEGVPCLDDLWPED